MELVVCEAHLSITKEMAFLPLSREDTPLGFCFMFMVSLKFHVFSVLAYTLYIHPCYFIATSGVHKVQNFRPILCVKIIIPTSSLSLSPPASTCLQVFCQSLRFITLNHPCFFKIDNFILFQVLI